MPPEVTVWRLLVEVFYPRQAPHLAPIARANEAAIAGDLDRTLRALQSDPARAARAVAHITAEAKAADALERFRRALAATVGIG